MPKEAIPGDVSEAEGVFNSDRLARMKQISAERDAERDSEDAEDAMNELAAQAEALDDELKTIGGGDPDYEDDEGEASESEQEEDDDTEQDEDGEGDKQEDADPEATNEADSDAETDDDPQSPLFFENGEWMARIKVDGEVKTVPYSKIQAAAQKLEAGDKRLEEANRLMKEIEEREKRLLDPGQADDQPPAQGADGQGQSENGQNQEILELTRQYHDALLRGEDEDVTANLLAKLATAGGRAPQVDVDKLVEETERRVEARLEQRQKEEAERKRKEDLSKAFTTFKSEFKDLAKDQELLRVADSFTLKVAAENPTLSPLEVMREAGKRTRTWVKEKSGDTPRVNRKRKLKTVAGNGARQTPAPAEKPKKRGDVINELRRSRGQPALG
jgi:hypothetical protein